jgi:hypothetical protein
MRHLARHGPCRAHIMENDHRSNNAACPVVDRGGGIFDGGFKSIAADEDAIYNQSHSPLMGHGLADWLGWIRTSTVGGDPAYFGQSGQVFLMRTVFEGKQPQPPYLNSKKLIRTCARL